MRFIFALLLLHTVTLMSAQSQRKKTAVYRPGPTSLEPSPYTAEVYGPKIAKKKSRVKAPSIETREEFEARMKRTAKAIKKREKLLRKPQYSDPLYFGHKRPPKKHKAGKLKFCKECEMRH